ASRARASGPQPWASSNSACARRKSGSCGWSPEAVLALGDEGGRYRKIVTPDSDAGQGAQSRTGANPPGAPPAWRKPAPAGPPGGPGGAGGRPLWSGGWDGKGGRPRPPPPLRRQLDERGQDDTQRA